MESNLKHHLLCRYRYRRMKAKPIATRQGIVYITRNICANNGEGRHHKDLQLTDEEMPEMKKFKDRLATFMTWPKQLTQKPARLAACGFFYSGFGDCVNCYNCGLPVHSWRARQSIKTLHYDRQPDCELATRQIKEVTRRRMVLKHIREDVVELDEETSENELDMTDDDDVITEDGHPPSENTEEDDLPSEDEEAETFKDNPESPSLLEYSIDSDSSTAKHQGTVTDNTPRTTRSKAIPIPLTRINTQSQPFAIVPQVPPNGGEVEINTNNEEIFHVSV